jgi:hypothetical protein
MPFNSLSARRPRRFITLAVAVGLMSMANVAPASATVNQISSVLWDAPYVVKFQSNAILNTGNIETGGSASTLLPKILAAYKVGKVVRMQNGSGVVRPCHLDVRFINGLYRLTVLLDYKLTVTSVNRWCDWDSADYTSFHVKYGGGGAMDIGSFVPPGKSRNDANYENLTKRKEIDKLIAEVFYAAGAKGETLTSLGPWQIGQKYCNRSAAEIAAWTDQGYLMYTDTCNHIHLSFSGTDRSYPY